MKKLLLPLVLCVAAAAANARCLTNDKWTGPDKVKHFGAGMAIGSGVTLLSRRPDYGFWAGAAAGVLIETRGVCSLQDAVVTAVGAGAGAYGTYWLVLPQRGGLQVAFASRF